MKAQRCPVCEGRGNVPSGFYEYRPGTTASLPTYVEKTVECRACSGRGYLLLNDWSEFPMPQSNQITGVHIQ